MSCNLPKIDLLSDLKSHKCQLCEKCLVCHHCLLARGYLRKQKIDIPEEQVNTLLNVLLHNDDDDPPRYILVGPDNEIIESKPNVVHLKPDLRTKTYLNRNHKDKKSSDIDPSQSLEVQLHEPPELHPEPVQTVVEPMFLMEPVSFNCCECDKKFPTAHDFNMHKIYHSVEELFECKTCHQTFNHSYELIKHSVYHNAKTFVCEYCEKRYATEKKLQMHMRLHTGTKPFVCTICEKAFKENGTLKSHLLIHTDTRPYMCQVCGRSFRQKYKLDRHNWIHEGIKPYVCVVCDKAFRHKCNLKSHCLRHHDMLVKELTQGIDGEESDI